MTVQEFNIHVRNKTKSEKVGYWVQSISVAGSSLFCIVYVNIKSDKLGNKIPIGVTYILLCVLAISIISIYQLLKKYRITTVLNNNSSKIKHAAIVAAFARLPAILEVESDNYMTFIYQKNKSVDYQIDLVYDETQVCFSVIRKGVNYGGPIDFGNATKLRNIITNELRGDLDK
ncbi:MAG TPA: hypothetical protein VFT78_15500 [Hanamia sp.]|jgi:hypothetical protein|nr:hypothetical protein [Hanamia sp.]